MMPQNETDGGPGELSPAQEIALEQLVAGETVTAAAQAAGVDRTTVHRWKREPTFEAAYNRLRAELRDATEARLLRLAEKAARTLEAALDAGDARIGLGVLKGMGLLPEKRPAFGPETPEALEQERERSRAIAELLPDPLESLRGPLARQDGPSKGR